MAAVTPEPTADLLLVVTGPTTRLEHRATIVPDRVTLEAEVRPGETRRLELTPAFLTAALVRLTRMRPRRPDDAGTAFRWELSLDWPGGSRRLSAHDGPGGLHLASAGDVPRPVSNTEAYRILSTLLPAVVTVD